MRCSEWIYIFAISLQLSGAALLIIKYCFISTEKAIKNNYKMDKKYENRYKKINEFHDGKNYKRLIEELQQLNII